MPSSERITWSSITSDDEPSAADAAADPPAHATPGFQFDLGSALARLDDPAAPARPPEPAAAGSLGAVLGPPAASGPTADRPGGPSPLVAPHAGPITPEAGLPTGPPRPPLVSRAEVATDLAALTSLAAPSPGDLPQRAPSPALDPLPHREPPARAAAREAPAPGLPSRTRSPAASPAPPARRSMFDETAHGEARSALHRVPSTTNVAVAAQDMPTLPPPSLPESLPAPPPTAVKESDVPMPTASDVRQFRTAQARAARKKNGRLFLRVLMVFVLFGASIGLALTVGRQWMFPTDWDPALTRLVDTVQVERGVEFERVVPLVTQPAAEYAATVARLVLGGDVAGHLPVWRALGLASGAAVDDPALGEALAAARPALYDTEAASIFALEGAPADVDLRIALEQALDEQLGSAGPRAGDAGGDTGGIAALGLVPVRDLVVAADAAPATASIAGAAEPVLPLPLVYQLAAGDRLATAYTATSAPALDDFRGTAPEPVLAAGDVAIGDAVGLGIDDWTLVWANRLPAEAVDRLIAATSGDAVRTFERAGTACVAAVFQAANELYGAAILADLGTWAAAAPPASQTSVTAVGPTAVQLTACDPGDIAQTVDPAAAEAVISRQLGRLTAG
jgi:hypothetical protein